MPVASRRDASSSGSCRPPPFGDTRALSRLVWFLTKKKKKKQLIIELRSNISPQIFEQAAKLRRETAILRSLFSCFLLWFDWAGEPCLVPPKSAQPGSNKPHFLTAAVWLAEAGRSNPPTVTPFTRQAAA